MASMTDDKLTSVVYSLVRDCERYRDENEKERTRATEYYDGDITDPDMQVDPGHSKAVSRDVRSNIKKVLPSIIRTILGNEKVVEYVPVGEGDEAGAEQATEFVNYVVFPESDGYEAVQDAIHDALKLRNGIIRWYYDKRQCVTVSSYTGLDEQALVQLVAEDSVSVLEQESTQEPALDPTGQPLLDPMGNPAVVTYYSVKIRRRHEKGRTKIEAVPPEQLLVHPDALDIEESPITGVNMRLRRSDLVAMGYDRELIESIPAATTNGDKEDEEDARRREVFRNNEVAADRSMEELEYYELYVRIDHDDDGIAELRRIVYAGDIKPDYLLANEECDEVPFADITTERRPHQREGMSVADDLIDIQRIKTTLVRETLDNIYWQNKPQPIVQEGTVSNPDAVLNPAFGKPIRVSRGTPVDAAIGFTKVPFVAQSSFSMLSYMDAEATDRTGISDASSGLSPDALQNMTATATALIEQGGIGQTELMVRTVARGLKKVFRGVLKLVVKHQDKPRTVRLRDKWVTYDPRQWNSDMDVTVNVGLGAGTRERDMAMMQAVLGIQKELLASFGAANNPFVKPDQLYNTISKLIETAGLNSVDPFVTKPDEAEIKKLLDAQANKPDPAMQKLQAEMQFKQEQAKLDFQLEQMKIAANKEVEMARLQQEGELKRYQIDQELALKRQQNVAEALSGAPLRSVSVGGMPG